jgi:hypothetical protein
MHRLVSGLKPFRDKAIMKINRLSSGNQPKKSLSVDFNIPGMPLLNSKVIPTPCTSHLPISHQSSRHDRSMA